MTRAVGDNHMSRVFRGSCGTAAPLKNIGTTPGASGFPKLVLQNGQTPCWSRIISSMAEYTPVWKEVEVNAETGKMGLEALKWVFGWTRVDI